MKIVLFGLNFDELIEYVFRDMPPRVIPEVNNNIVIINGTPNVLLHFYSRREILDKMCIVPPDKTSSIWQIEAPILLISQYYYEPYASL